jgi:hypothetical protein
MSKINKYQSKGEKNEQKERRRESPGQIWGKKRVGEEG